MAKSLDRVQPVMAPLPPNIQPWVLSGVKLLLPYWLHRQCRVVKYETRHMERLVELTQQFQAGKVRYLVAFRHPGIDDQFSMFRLFAVELPRAAAQMGVKFAKSPHSYYVYDRGIPLWAGEIVTWLFPRTGGIPIHRGKSDRQGLQMIRQCMTDGDFPLSISPEGGTNGHSELISPIEPGVAQIGFWCAEDLAKAGRTEEVKIVPVGLQYEYVGDVWSEIDQFLMAIERDCGLTKPPVQPQERYQRLYDLGEHLVNFVGSHYAKFYPLSTPSNLETGDLGTRLQALLEHILSISEYHFGIKPKGTTIDRCRRLEQTTWSQIFRTDIKDIKALSPLEQGFANHLAKEAHNSEWHMRIAESLTAVTGKYVNDHRSSTRFAETLLLIWRALNRVKAKPFGRPPHLGDRACTISIGEPLSVTGDRFTAYQSNRATAKQAVNNLTQDLQQAMESLIFPSAMR